MPEGTRTSVTAKLRVPGGEQQLASTFQRMFFLSRTITFQPMTFPLRHALPGPTIWCCKKKQINLNTI